MKLGLEDKVPTNLTEAFELLNLLEGLNEFKSTDEKQAIACCHHSLGQWIRNNWGLWRKEGRLYEYLTSIGLYHPDDMSSLILTSFHRYLNGKSLNLDDQVMEYKKFWNNQAR